MNHDHDQRGSGPIVAESFHVGSRTYELRWVNCGKSNCRKCTTDNGSRASHGPYWYLCVPKGKKWFRIYIGKHLDTNLHVLPDGKIDWKSVNAKRTRSNDPVVRDNTEIPGQLDALDAPAPKPPAPRRSPRRRGFVKPA